MFGKQDLKQEIAEQLSSLSTTINQRLQEQENSINALKNLVSELKQSNVNSAEDVRKELEEISSIKTDFERALNRVDSMSFKLEDNVIGRVREIAETEIESIKKSSAKFRDSEELLRAVVDKINRLQLEISKFISISQQINLVDFSLKKHKEDVENYQKEKNSLLEENEDLKSKMAKMIRNRSPY